jgi:hypothetical protein
MIRNLLIILTILVIVEFWLERDVVMAQTKSMQTISKSDAVEDPIRLNLYPGRATAIDLSQTKEIIISVLLADQSNITYTSDYPIESGRSKTLFLRRIQDLDFPGATEATVTNLWVKTRSPDGTEHLYSFDLFLASGGVGMANGVQILPEKTGQSVSSGDRNNSLSSLSDNTLIVSNGRRATISDIEEGLQIAIRRGYTPADDPIVLKIEEILLEVRNSSQSLDEAAQQRQVDVLVLSKLAEIALDNYSSTSPTPLPAYSEPSTTTIRKLPLHNHNIHLLPLDNVDDVDVNESRNL